MSQLPPDPVIAEIREVRRQISERFGHDLERLGAHFMELQKQYRDRLLGAAPSTPRRKKSAA